MVTFFKIILESYTKSGIHGIISHPNLGKPISSRRGPSRELYIVLGGVEVYGIFESVTLGKPTGFSDVKKRKSSEICVGVPCFPRRRRLRSARGDVVVGNGPEVS